LQKRRDLLLESGRHLASVDWSSHRIDMVQEESLRGPNSGKRWLLDRRVAISSQYKWFHEVVMLSNIL
jgi:hypothetical protein